MPKTVTRKDAQNAIDHYRGFWQDAKEKHAAHLGKVKFNRNLGPNFEKLLKLWDAYSQAGGGISEKKFHSAYNVIQAKLTVALDDYKKQVNAKVKDKQAKKDLLIALEIMYVGTFLIT